MLTIGLYSTKTEHDFLILGNVIFMFNNWLEMAVKLSFVSLIMVINAIFF